MYFKIKALHELGCKVHLHAFTYGDRNPSPELDKITESVQYYPRESIHGALLSGLPYIISSRASKSLERRLTAESFPVFFDGLHCAAFLDSPGLKDRIKILRLHNIEWQYYRALAKHSSALHMRMHYQLEWRKLRKFETGNLKNATNLLPISERDTDYFRSIYGDKVIRIPPFHKFRDVRIKTGKGDFVLFHGDLSVAENQRAVYTLIKDVFSKIPYKVVIAGRKPPPGLKKMIETIPNIVLKADVSSQEMQTLMEQAQIQVVHVLQTAGFKVKLLYAMFTARNCLCNTAGIVEHAFEPFVKIYNNPSEMIDLIESGMQQQITEEVIATRRKALFPAYDNLENARRILELVN
jgi:hypothetical protein